MTDTVQLVNLLLTAVLTGNELGTWAVVHPALHRLSLREEISAEQAITRRYGYFMPPLMLLTIATGFISAATLSGTPSRLVFAASGCFTVMLAITLLGNVPINLQTLRFDEQDQASWRQLRGQWDRLHLVRVVLDAAALVLIGLAAVD